MLLVLLVMILLFSVVTSIPCALALSTSLLVRSWSSPLLPPIKSISSASRRLRMGLPPMDMDMWWSWSVSCIIFSVNKLNRMAESKHPLRTYTALLSWRTPLADWEDCTHCRSSRIVPEWFEPVLPLYRELLKTCHRSACQTLSNTFLKSMKLWDQVTLEAPTTSRDLFHQQHPRYTESQNSHFVGHLNK